MSECGGPGQQHLETGQARTVEDELRRDVLLLRRKYVVLQPVLQRAVVGDAAQQGHRCVRMRVDEPGHEDGLWPIQPRSAGESTHDVRPRADSDYLFPARSEER